MLGSNVPTIGGLAVGFKWADDWGCECIQIYVSLSRRWEVTEPSEEYVAIFQSAWKQSGVKQIVAHVPFLVNLASANPSVRDKSIARLVHEARTAAKLGVPFLVLHPGSCGVGSRLLGLDLIVDGLNTVSDELAGCRSRILLENMAGQGSTLGSTFEELAEILGKVNDPSRFGVCLDTAHLYIAGYDLSGYEGYETVLTRFDTIVGLNRIHAIHINDAKTTLASRNDRHAATGEGTLGLQCFHALVRDPRLMGIPKILEVPERGQSKRSLDVLKSLRTRAEPIEEHRRTPVQLCLDGSIKDDTFN